MDASEETPKQAPKPPKRPVQPKQTADRKENVRKPSEITIREFLDFLKTAYQVQDNIEAILKNEGLSEIVNWIELKENRLVRPPEVASQTSETRVGDDGMEIKKKLSEVLSEGIFDSILPYIVPGNSMGCFRERRASIARLQGCGKVPSEEKIPVKSKSMEAVISMEKTVFARAESEVEIHVHDELKNIKKDFLCNQNLLIEQMGYFKTVTEGQKLEDMDISVHCDIGIFEFLMRWMKSSSREKPELDLSNAIPVLVSAAFLQMEPLTEECLRFVHSNLNEILKTNASLSCLNDTVVTRLAAMYTNSEVEEIRDRRDRIQSRLYCKLIQSLCEVEPESLRGHFATLGKVYKCRYCRQLVDPALEERVPCAAARTALEPDGAVASRHARDPSWTLTEHVAAARRAAGSWRRAYWRLWGDAHRLACAACRRPFAARRLGWCRHHPDAPQYFAVDAQRAPLPVGRYPCCGERAYRRHARDLSWTLTEHVAAARRAAGSWRRAYWRLWGDAHRLACAACRRPFAARRLGWCRHHPDAPQYFAVDAQRAPLPVGRYPCCGERAYRRHARDLSWTLTEHVAAARRAAGSWRRAYWRLWGDAHRLACAACRRPFAARRLGWCRHHPDAPQYFAVDAQRAPLPVGRYPCCGERAYRFQLLDDPSGCKFKDHEVSIKDNKDSLVNAMLIAYRDLITESPPELMFPERLTRLVARDNTTTGDMGDEETGGVLECKETMWWEGLEIVPPRPKLGMFGLLMDSEKSESNSEDSESDFTSDSSLSTSSTTSSSSESPGSEETTQKNSRQSRGRKLKSKSKKKCRSATGSSSLRLWQHKLSARSNQDLQRTCEESALRDMSVVLSRRLALQSEPQPVVTQGKVRGGCITGRRVTPPGGIWVRLESEWRESNGRQGGGRQAGGGSRARNRYR